MSSKAEFEKLVKQAIYTTLSALAEVPEDDFLGGAPESHIYIAACGSDLAVWECARELMKGRGWITVRGNVVRLTTEGRTLGQQINAALAGEGEK